MKFMNIVEEWKFGVCIVPVHTMNVGTLHEKLNRISVTSAALQKVHILHSQYIRQLRIRLLAILFFLPTQQAAMEHDQQPIRLAPSSGGVPRALVNGSSRNLH